MARTVKAQSVKESTKVAVQAADTSEAKKETMVTLSTGVVLRVLPPKTRVVYNLYMQNPEPRPPKILIQEGGKEWEEDNPGDEAYIAALAEHRQRLYESYVKIIILLSTEIVSLPQGMAAFDTDEDWQDEMEAIGLATIKTNNRKERYLEWFFYRIAPTHEDMFIIQNASEELSAVSNDGANAAAQETFQDNSR